MSDKYYCAFLLRQKVTYPDNEILKNANKWKIRSEFIYPRVCRYNLTIWHALSVTFIYDLGTEIERRTMKRTMRHAEKIVFGQNMLLRVFSHNTLASTTELGLTRPRERWGGGEGVGWYSVSEWARHGIIKSRSQQDHAQGMEEVEIVQIYSIAHRFTTSKTR